MTEINFFQLPHLTAEIALAEFEAGRLKLVDLRKTAAVVASGHRISGADARDPFVFGHDDPMTDHDGPVATFCVHGHEVSRFGCALLMLHGRKAAYVQGGFEALKAAGARLVACA
ncbi:MAG: rhodanese-like domain-containing protein [Pseudomonadota bacterium]